MNKTTILISTLALLLLLAMLPTLTFATPPNDVDTAISTGMAYLDRMYYEFNSTHSACLDCPALSFRLKRNDDKWIIAGKKTGLNYVENPGGDQIAGGCLTELIGTMGGIGEAETIDWKFDINGDGQYGDIVLRTEYFSVNDTWMECRGKITSCDLKGYTASLWVGDDDKVINSVAVTTNTWDFDRTQEYGWQLQRYVNRHVTKQMANLYNYLGVWNGINYTARAIKLLRTWYDAGYKYDVNDASYFASNDGRPDYHVCNWAELEYSYGWIVSNDTYPDPEMWTNNPITISDTKFAYPYKSRLGYGIARDVWLYGAFVWTGIPLVPSAGGTYPLVDAGGYTIFGVGCQAQLNWALHLMNKYGTMYPQYFLAQAKAYIDEASEQWNGMGIVAETEGGITFYKNVAYGLHVVTIYAIALIRYYQLTGDEWYAERADEVIGVILILQQRVGHNQLVGEYGHEVYRADSVGGFMPGYRWGGGWEYWDCMSHAPMYGELYWALDLLAGIGDIFGIEVGYREDPCAFPGVCVTNTEASIPAVMSLFLYKQLGRTPSSSAVEFAFPFQDVDVTATNGGGIMSISYVKANRDGNIWMIAESHLTGAWCKIVYSWIFTTTTALTNFKFKIAFYVLAGGTTFMGGNSLSFWIELYKSGATTPFVSDKKIPLDGLNSGDYQYYYVYTNLASTTLTAGTYTVKLRFVADAGGGGAISIGYPDAEGGAYRYSDEPMHIEYFGYNSDSTYTPPAITYNLNIQSIGLGSTSPSGLHPYTEGTTATIIATPNTGKYFWFWRINNTSLNIGYCNYSETLEINVNHDYNITAYFGDWEFKLGDLGSGSPPTYFAFDGLIRAIDYTLWKGCFDGEAPFEAMCLGDLGSGPPPTFFQLDGKVNAWDYALWFACYQGCGP